MVFLGLEKPVEYGAQQIFDPTMANMVLQAQQQYNEAARREYERGLEDFDKFTTKYGDFISPFAKDMARYGEMIGGIQNVIDQAYKDGVDLLRSPEGRMLVHRLTNSVNPAEFNTMRSNAKMGYAYLDTVQKLRAQGKYSEAQELFDIMQNGGLGTDSNGNPITDFSQFSTAGNGGFNTFNRTPIEAVTLRELTQDSYKGRTPRVLNQQDFNDPRLKDNGYTWDPNYEWTGYLRSDLLKNAPGAILSLAADPRFAFFREQARQMVMARGEEPTADAVQKQLMENIADANTWALVDPTRKANEFALDNHRTANDIRAHAANKATDYYYDILPYADADGDGKLSKEERAAYAASGGGRRKQDHAYNIFREAESLLPKQSATDNIWGTKAGMHVGYVPSGQYEELIDPIIPATYLEDKDKDSGQVTEMYQFDASKMNGRVYSIDDSGNVQKLKMFNNSNSTRFTFIPDGQMKAARTANGYRYYISGQIQGNKSDRSVHDTNYSNQVWIEVKERGHRYDGTGKR